MWERNLNTLMAILIAAVLWGALCIQFIKQETPCPLCFLQRLGMLGVAAGALMNVKFGPRKIHYGLSLLSTLFGGFVALRQIALHVCPQFPTFGHPFWGLSLYTWSFILFACSVAYIALLLIIFEQKTDREGPKRPNGWGHLAFALVFLVALTNIFTTLWQCGLTPCTDV
jgi:disulfide bond formation protein DsbB